MPEPKPETKSDVSADTSSHDTDNTSEIRLLKRAQRRLLPEATQKQHGVAICQQLQKHRCFQYGQHIGLYLANDGEVDPNALIERAWFQNKTVYLPVLSPLNNSLYFAPYSPDSQLILNRFSIPEPKCHPSRWKTAAQLDALFLPLVAFDPYGNRIGMGGGFYDRTLAYLQLRQHWRKPTLIGLAHEIQKVGSLNRQHWDIPLNLIVTERQIYNDKNS